MSYTATIQRVADGAMFDVPMQDGWGENEEFLWSDGRYGCDCNRAALVDDPDDYTCGNERYRVRITLPDGSVPYDEITDTVAEGRGE